MNTFNPERDEKAEKQGLPDQQKPRESEAGSDVMAEIRGLRRAIVTAIENAENERLEKTKTHDIHLNDFKKTFIGIFQGFRQIKERIHNPARETTKEISGNRGCSNNGRFGPSGHTIWSCGSAHLDEYGYHKAQPPITVNISQRELERIQAAEFEELKIRTKSEYERTQARFQGYLVCYFDAFEWDEETAVTQLGALYVIHEILGMEGSEESEEFEAKFIGCNAEFKEKTTRYISTGIKRKLEKAKLENNVTSLKAILEEIEKFTGIKKLSL